MTVAIFSRCGLDWSIRDLLLRVAQPFWPGLAVPSFFPANDVSAAFVSGSLKNSRYLLCCLESRFVKQVCEEPR